MTGLVLLLLLGTAGSALCAGAETGYYVLNPVQLRHLAREDRRAAVLERVVRSPAGFLAALLVGNNLANNLAVHAGLGLGRAAGLSETEAGAAATLVLTPLLFLLGEVGPKRHLLRDGLRRMLRLAPLLALLRLLLLPVTGPLAAVVRAVGGVPEEGLGRRHLLALLRAGRGGGGAVTAAARALEASRAGLGPFLRRDLPLLDPAEGRLVLAQRLAATRDGLGLVRRPGRPPGLLAAERLALLPAGVPVEAAVEEPVVLPPDVDLAGALAELRRRQAGLALVGRPGAWSGVLDLEEVLARLLRPRPAVESPSACDPEPDSP